MSEPRQAFISGAYTDPDHPRVLRNIAAALEAGRSAAAMGWAPIVPHAMFNHRETDWETAMTRCRALIRGLEPGRDILVALPAWAESRGAREEVALALSLGVEVVQLYDLRPVTSVTHWKKEQGTPCTGPGVG